MKMKQIVNKIYQCLIEKIKASFDQMRWEEMGESMHILYMVTGS